MTLCHSHTLYRTRRCILHPHFIRYRLCSQNFKYALEMVRILQLFHSQDMAVSHIMHSVYDTSRKAIDLIIILEEYCDHI